MHALVVVQDTPVRMPLATAGVETADRSVGGPDSTIGWEGVYSALAWPTATQKDGTGHETPLRPSVFPGAGETVGFGLVTRVHLPQAPRSNARAVPTAAMRIPRTPPPRRRRFDRPQTELCRRGTRSRGRLRTRPRGQPR
jgi:hypothetical protein